MLTQKRLREMLDYDEHTGLFHWLVSIKGVRAGSLAGCSSSPNRYGKVKIDRRSYRTNRLAWLYVYGEFPDAEVDHKNGCKTDNRLSNLRLATRSQNQNNIPARKGSSTGLKGVTLHKATGKYQAQIKINGKNRYLGLFELAEAAHTAYSTEAIKAHGEFICGVSA